MNQPQVGQTYVNRNDTSDVVHVLSVSAPVGSGDPIARNNPAVEFVPTYGDSKSPFRVPLRTFQQVYQDYENSTRSRRPTVDEYFVRMAHLASTRATCDRKHVGAVLTRQGRTVGTGYNGSPPGMPHCDDVGHDLVTLADGSVNCVRTTHAEANAFLDAAMNGKATDGTTLYTNTFPCWNCAKMILGSGVVRVVFDADYNNDARVTDAFKSRGIALVRYKDSEAT